MGVLRYSVLAAALVFGVAANDIPNGADGVQNAAVHDGKQNYPVTLQGVSREWARDCRRGDEDECLRLGDAFLEGLGDLKQDLRAAMGYWLLGCDAGSDEACVKAAEAIELGTTNYPANPRLAYDTASKGCARGDHSSCAITALHTYRGEVVAADRSRAMGLWDTGCAAGNEDSCRLQAGALYYDGDGKADQRQAAVLFTDGCAERGQGWACSGLAEAARTGTGLAKDEAFAEEVAEFGCMEGEGGNTLLACTIHGATLSRSRDADKLTLASNLLSSACLAGQAEACYHAGNLGWEAKDGVTIADWEVPLFFRDGCDMGFAQACSGLGELYFSGIRVKQNYARAALLYDKGCKLGDQIGCAGVGQFSADSLRDLFNSDNPINAADPAEVQIAQALELIDDPQRGESAMLMVGRLMEEGVADAQWLMGGWFYYGLPGLLDQNRGNGIILIENAARQRHLEALKWISMAYWEGDGVAMNRDLGAAFMSHAAAQGDEMAIAIYRSMLLQPERDRRAREAEEARRLAEERRNDFWYNFSLAVSAQASSYAAGPSRSYSSAAADASWQRHQNAMDQLHWNQRMSYLTGGTTACNTSNPYC